jgi:hypothetical protein
MTDHRNLKALADDPAAVRRLATFLRELPEAAWTDWELDFLAGLTERQTPATPRQAEMIVELRDAAVPYRSWEGFSVTHLVCACWENRLELSEDDEAFIVDLKAQDAKALRRRALYRLVRIAREVGVLDQHVAA